MRHDRLGQEVQRWFKQLRRLQSYLHAAKAASSAPAAVSYRLDLWSAIKHARGFQGGFVSWWKRRNKRLAGSPALLPMCPPEAQLAACVFEDFRANYRALEQWHLLQRRKLLDCKHQQSMSQLFNELRQPRPASVDTITVRREYAVLASESLTQLVHLDSPPDLRGFSTWSLESKPADLYPVGSSTCKLESVLVPEEGHTLVQVQTLVTPRDVQSEFVQLWKPRWQRHEKVPPERWNRILGFARAILPRFNICLRRISVMEWKQAVKRFKLRAARGPCGWARLDLLHMSEQHVQALLELLQRVEAGVSHWPEQLLEGIVCALDKNNGRQDANGYRPIVLFSMIYRCWAGLRARQLLRALQHLVPADLFGFVPNREAQELWYALQLQVEACCQGSTDIFGLSTDLVKAFNQLPRDPVFGVAEAIGVPSCVTLPWASFLSSVRRRFQVGAEVGEPVTSVTGFPEGCPLSPVAMLLVDWTYHVYQSQFAPSARSLSYVDNLSSTASSLPDIARSFSAAVTFCEAMDLQLDSEKTFFWTSNSKCRPALALLGAPVLSEAWELGGFMSYQGRTRNKGLVERCQSLAPDWQALKRSRASTHQKLGILALKFWPKALHGIAGVPLAESRLQALRTAATSAIGIRPGGASSLLRLALAPDLTADPGFYQLWTCVRDVRRMSVKLPAFLLDWKRFMGEFDGRTFQGPLSKLMLVLNQVGWTVLRPPCVQDHEGLCHDLEHAWLCHVATSCGHA